MPANLSHDMGLRLFNSQVSIDTGISCSASQILVFPIHNVHFCSCISVFLGQSKVNDEQLKCVWCGQNREYQLPLLAIIPAGP